MVLNVSSLQIAYGNQAFRPQLIKKLNRFSEKINNRKKQPKLKQEHYCKEKIPLNKSVFPCRSAVVQRKKPFGNNSQKIHAGSLQKIEKNNLTPYFTQGGGSESMDGQGVCHFGSWSGTQKFNFRIKILPKNLFYKIIFLLFQKKTMPH